MASRAFHAREDAPLMIDGTFFPSKLVVLFMQKLEHLPAVPILCPHLLIK
jgi:hypothetical protein